MNDRTRHWLLLLLPLAILFGPLLAGNQLLAFRDGGHFYFPLLSWLDAEHRAGEFPLWNPYDGLGTPVAGDSSSALFYPGRLIFFLPGSAAFRYHIYVIGHLAGCALAAGWLARRWECSYPAATLAGLAYAFSGSVLFQVYNVIFLVGACWFPLALAGGWEIVQGRSYRGVMLIAPALALMILGGDPQSAVHSLLATIVLAGCVPASTWRHRRQQLVRLLAPLSLTVALAGALAAAQIVPSFIASRQSERAFSDRPRSLWQAFRYLPTAEGRQLVVSGLIGPTQEGTFDHSVYEFSVPPWRAIEFVWPNASGAYFPTSRRWLLAIDGEERIWAPNLYFGLLPVLLLAMLVGCAFWRKRLIVSGPWRGLLWMAFLAILASCGWYGPAALIKAIAPRLGLDSLPWLGSQVGSLVWFLGLLLPGYGAFRYPAKWLIVAALPIALAAAKAWDLLEANRDLQRIAKRIVLAAAMATAVVLAILLATRPFVWQPWAQQLPGDTIFGPFDVSGSWVLTLCSLIQTIVIAGLLVGVVSPSDSGDSKQPTSRNGWIAVLITIADLIAAQGMTLPTTSLDHLQPSPAFARSQLQRDPGVPPARFQRMVDNSSRPPESWRIESTNRRLDELAAWEWSTLAGKTHLAIPATNLEAQQTLARAELSALLRKYRSTTLARSGIGPLGADYLLASQRFPLHEGSPWLDLKDDELLVLGDASLFRRPDAPPRAWVASTVIRRPIQHPLSAEELRRITDDAVLTRPSDLVEGNASKSRWRDMVAFPLVESDAPLEHSMPALDWSPGGPPESLLDEQNQPPGAGNGEFAPTAITSYGVSEVVVKTRLAKPGLLVLSDQYDADWTAERTSPANDRPIPCQIVRTNRVMRGVALPAGEHTVVFRYQPIGTYMALSLSVVTWIAFWVFCRRVQNTRQVPL
jgi:hypothetical protein